MNHYNNNKRLSKYIGSIYSTSIDLRINTPYNSDSLLHAHIWLLQILFLSESSNINKSIRIVISSHMLPWTLIYPHIYITRISNIIVAILLTKTNDDQILNKKWPHLTHIRKLLWALWIWQHYVGNVKLLNFVHCWIINMVGVVELYLVIFFR